MAANLAVIISAVDRASGTLDRVNKKAGGLGRSFGKVLKVGALAAVPALGALGAVGIKAVQSLARIERIGAQTEAVIKSTGGAANVSRKQIDDLAGRLERMTSVEAETITEGANLLLTFTNIRNEVGKGNDIFNQTLPLLTDMSVALGQDMNSSAIQVGKALNDPIKGITALRRVGVSFTKDQIEQVKTLVESGRTMDAQKLILKELTTEFGGSGEALGKTFSGQLKIVGHELGTITETIMSALLPSLTGLARKVSSFLIAHQDDIERFVQAFVRFAGSEILPRIGAGFQVLVRVGERVFDALRPIIKWFLEDGQRLQAVGVAIGAVVATMFTVWAVTAGAAAVATIAAAAPVLALLAAIGLLAAGIFLLVKNWDKVKAFVMDSIKAFVSWLERNWKQIVQIALAVLFPPGAGLFWIITHFGTVKEKVLGIVDLLKRNTIDKVTALATDVVSWIKGIPGKLADIAGTFLTVGKNLMESLGEGIRQGINGVIGFVERGINNIISRWNSLEFKLKDPTGVLGKVGLPSEISVGTPDLPLISIPRLQQGGRVLRTGLAVVERGEIFSGVTAGGRPRMALAGAPITINLTIQTPFNLMSPADQDRAGRALVAIIRRHI